MRLLLVLRLSKVVFLIVWCLEGSASGANYISNLSRKCTVQRLADRVRWDVFALMVLGVVLREERAKGYRWGPAGGERLWKADKQLALRSHRQRLYWFYSQAEPDPAWKPTCWFRAPNVHSQHLTLGDHWSRRDAVHVVWILWTSNTTI